jgi:hypothetical protein
VINAALLCFAGYEFYTEYYITGYFVGLGLFNKTYHGGMNRAGILAEQKNVKGLNKFNSSVGSILIRIMNSAESFEKSLISSSEVPLIP